MRFLFTIVFGLFFCTLATADEGSDLTVSIPDGESGRIYIDGVDTGKDAPHVLKNIAPGTHKVEVRGDCTIASSEVTVVAGSPAQIDLQPTSMGGFVEIEVNPATAKIYLNDQPIGTGPNIGLEVDCGRQVFSFRALQYAPTERTVDIGMGNVKRIKVELKSAGTGSIAIKVAPNEAEVFLDGKNLGVGSQTVDGIPQGSHLVGAMLEGYIPQEKRVQVKSGSLPKVILQLEKEPEATEEATETETPPTVESTETTPPTEEPSTDDNPKEGPKEEPVVSTDLQQPSAVAIQNPRRGREVAAISLLSVSTLSAYFSWRSWNDITMERYKNYVEKSRDESYFLDSVRPAQLVTVGLSVIAGATLMSGSALLYYDNQSAGLFWSSRF